MLQHRLSALYCSLSSLSIVEKTSFVTPPSVDRLFNLVVHRLDGTKSVRRLDAGVYSPPIHEKCAVHLCATALHPLVLSFLFFCITAILTVFPVGGVRQKNPDHLPAMQFR